MRFLLNSYAFVGFIVTLCSLFAMLVSAYERISIKPAVAAFISSVVASVSSVYLAEYVFT